MVYEAGRRPSTHYIKKKKQYNPGGQGRTNNQLAPAASRAAEANAINLLK